jgi:hypothetical protein
MSKEMGYSSFPRDASNRDLRRQRRYAVDAGVLEVSWINITGKMETTRTRALNVSEDGMALQLPTAAMPTRVRFRSDRFKFCGTGAVRYCRRSGPTYIVGVEFIEGLHWSPPSEDVQEPIPLCDPESAFPPAHT